MAVTKASSRFKQVSVTDNGNTLELGPGAKQNDVGTFMIQFAPSADFVGGFLVVGKILGTAADTAPFLPIAYRRVNVAGAVSDYALSPDLIAAAGIIQVPANGLTIGLVTQCTAGTCQIYSWDMVGPSAI